MYNKYFLQDLGKLRQKVRKLNLPSPMVCVAGKALVRSGIPTTFSDLPSAPLGCSTNGIELCSPEDDSQPGREEETSLPAGMFHLESG